MEGATTNKLDKVEEILSLEEITSKLEVISLETKEDRVVETISLEEIILEEATSSLKDKIRVVTYLLKVKAQGAICLLRIRVPTIIFLAVVTLSTVTISKV